MQKTIVDGDFKTTTDYLSGFQYKDGMLHFFPHAEGYVNVENGKIFNYVFNYTDHLGNIRLSYAEKPGTSSLKIIEESNYYPFGLKHENYNAQKYDFKQNALGTFVVLAPTLSNDYKYKYNGKELQDELGLNFYDYGARNYDPALGRWMNIDPLAENYYRTSPFTYVFNNPLSYIDPTGMAVEQVEGGYRFTGQDAQNAFSVLKASMNNDNTKGSVGIINFGEGPTDTLWGDAMKELIPNAIVENVSGEAGKGGINGLIGAMKNISDKSPNGIGFLAIFSHGEDDRNRTRSTFGEGMIFADAASDRNPDGDNVYTSDLSKIGDEVSKNTIRFVANPTIYLGGCNTSTLYKSINFPGETTFAFEMAKATHATVYGAMDGHMNAKNHNNIHNRTFYPDKAGSIMKTVYYPSPISVGTGSQVINPTLMALKYLQN